MTEKATCSAFGRCGGRGMVVCFGSWHPAQERYSPGCTNAVERIVWIAAPSASSTWKMNCLPAGASKWQLPSSSIGTVPSGMRGQFSCS